MPIRTKLRDFPGLDDIIRAAEEAIRPERAISVAEWADMHRVLSTRTASEPGRYRTARTPYMREIMDALSPHHPARRVVMMKSAQVGATEAGTNWIGYVIHLCPGPMMIVQPTVELAKRFSKQRLDQLIADTPVVREHIPPARSRDSGNTMLSKEFPGGIIIVTGANSAVGLRSMPARFLFLDEVDAYPPSVDEEGDPVQLAERRAQTFGHRAKVFLISTPKLAGFSRIELEYERSDKRVYEVPCPRCGTYQQLVFERLVWPKGRPHEARYKCEACEEFIAEHHKTWMLAEGRWTPTAEPEDPHTVGFHISALYAPLGWVSWADIARQWELAKTDEERQSFVNTVLGLPWQAKGETPEPEIIYGKRENWLMGVAPEGVQALTAGVDVQGDRLEVSVWGWGRGLEAWLVEHIVIDGPPERSETWFELGELLDRTWEREDGTPLRLRLLGIDTGYASVHVYQWLRQVDPQAVGLKGMGGFNRTAPVAGPTYVDIRYKGKQIRRAAKVWTVSVAVFKSELYRKLKSDPESGGIHLPHDVPFEFVRQLCSEQLVAIRDKRGFKRLEWQKIRDRNEALDCFVMARAAAWIAGLDIALTKSDNSATRVARVPQRRVRGRWVS